MERLLACPRAVVSAKGVRGFLDACRDQEREWRERPPLEVRLEGYDALLGGWEDDEAGALAPSVSEEVEA